MRNDHQSIDCFEAYLLILSFCMSKWRTTKEIVGYFDIPQRTAQRYVKQLINRGYLERNGKTVGATRKAYIMLLNGVRD